MVKPQDRSWPYFPRHWRHACLSAPHNFGRMLPPEPNYEWGLADMKGGTEVVKGQAIEHAVVSWEPS